MIKTFLAKKLDKIVHYLMYIFMLCFIGYIYFSSIIQAYTQYNSYNIQQVMSLIVLIITFQIFAIALFFISKGSTKNISQMLKETTYITRILDKEIEMEKRSRNKLKLVTETN
jgi:hypothetical protein